MFRYSVILFFLARACFAQDVARMDQVVKSFVSAKQFMGTVLVAKDSRTAFSKGYGSANLEWGIPNTPSTKFRLGSLTKQFTAVSILLLEERGKLRLEDPIKKYLPDAPDAWKNITFFHLLTHTSGITSFTDFPEYTNLKKIPREPTDIVGLFREKPLKFDPGEKWEYSNSGYVLLGYLIEKISGLAYGKFVEDNIFKPLAMKDSGYDSNSAVIVHRASGYAPSQQGFISADYIDMSIPHAAGGLYSTTEDLLVWEQGLFGGKLLSAASLNKMIMPFKDGYAFGLGIETSAGRKVIFHSGGIDGFNTRLVYYPDAKITVAVLSNLEGSAVEEIATKLAMLAFGENVVLASERKEMAVLPKLLSEYVGAYELQPGFNLVMTLEGGKLMTQATGQPKFPLFAESEAKFFLKVVDAQVTFVKDDTGQVTQLMLHQNGIDQLAKKIK